MKRLIGTAGMVLLLASAAPAQPRGFMGGLGFRGFGPPGIGHGGFVGGGGFRLFIGRGFGHFGFGGVHGFLARPNLVFGGVPSFRSGLFSPFLHRRSFFTPWVVPVFAGGYVNSLPYPAATAPSVIVVYPPAPAPVDQDPEADGYEREASQPAPAARPRPNPVFVLIPLKDHRVHSAVAYWMERGDLHFVTLDGRHDRVRLEDVDRGMAERLNRGRPMPLQLP